MSWLSKLFGNSDKGIVGQVTETVDRFAPSAVKKHEMALDDLKAGDASQESARAMQFTSHNTWFDSFVDGLNRLPRPLLMFWAIGVLFGFINPPTTVTELPALYQNILWTIFTFLFGQRVLIKDIPAVIAAIRK